MKIVLAVRLGVLSLLISAVSPSGHAQLETDALAKPCVIVMGGGGVVTGNDTVDGQWFAINSAVSRAAMEKLKESGLRTIDFVVDIRDANKRATEMAREMENSKCQTVLQIVSDLRPRSRTKPPEKFAFIATVLELDRVNAKKGGGGTFKMSGKYSKDYEFAMTREVLETVSMSEVGEKLARDVIDSGVLK